MTTISIRSKAAIFILACALAAAVPSGVAFAQGGVNGSIVGYVFDQTGAPIRGVKVAATSDTQIGGAKVAYTNDEGYFRIVGLLPGEFQVSATAPKLKSVLQKGITVGLNAPAEANLVMEVEAQVEEVKVIDKAPIISTTTANVKTTFDAEFLENLPLDNRGELSNTIGMNTPGATGRGTIAGSNAWGLVWNIEGFNMGGQGPAMASVAATEVHTAGYGADNANVSGAVISLVSKSGSNKFEAYLNGFFEDSNLRFFTDNLDGTARTWKYHLNPQFSGPIIKDRLWFFISAEGFSTTNDPQADPARLTGDPVTRSELEGRGSIKFTWQVTPRNKLTSYSQFRYIDEKNQQSATTFEREAQSQNGQQSVFTGLIWEALLSDNVFFRSQAGYVHRFIYDAPERCRTEPVACDHYRQVRQTFPQTLRFNSYDVRSQEVTRTFEIINQIEWFAHSKTFGEHSLKLKARHFFEDWGDTQSTPGDGWTQYNGTTPDRERTYYSNDPRLEEARFGWAFRRASNMTNIVSATDAMRLTRYLTFSPGLALSHFDSGELAKNGDLKGLAVTPHLSAAWDATHDGRTVIRGSFNQYVDVPNVRRLTRAGMGERVWQECRWNEGAQAFNSQCVYGGGSSSNTIGLPCGPTGVNHDGTTCREKLKVPRTWEYTAGVEREIVQGIALGADVMYRLFTYPYERIETNRLWSQSAYTLDPIASYRNGRNETILNLATPGDARRRYLAMTATLRKREGAVKAQASYTWSRQEGNVDLQGNTDDGEYGNNPANDAYYLYGFVAYDYRHDVRTSLTYQITKWFSLGSIVRYRTGYPYQRKFRNDVLGNFTDYRAPVGINPGANLNDPGDDTALRSPDVLHTALHARFNLKPLTGQNLEAYVDVNNILALRTPIRIRGEDGPTWGTYLERMGPPRVRLGFRIRY